MTGFKLATLRFVVLTLLIFAASQVPTFASEKSFTFVNMSDKTFWRLYVCQSNAWGGWGEYKDLLKQPLHYGEQVKISFSEEAQHVRYWDIKIDFKDGKWWLWQELDLLNVSKIIVTSKDGKGKLHLE